MTNSDVSTQLLHASQRAAREASESLAEAIERLDAHRAAFADETVPAAELEPGLSSVAKELEDPPSDVQPLRQTLGKAVGDLQPLLDRLKAVDEPPAPVQDLATELAGILARLHPSHDELSRSGDDDGSRPSNRPSRPSELPEGADRRKDTRVDLDVGIGFQSETNFYTGFSADISEGGLFVATYDVLPLGTELTVSFVLPDGPQVTVRGRVAWVREPMDFSSDLHPGMGVAFGEVPEEARTAIHRFIRLREPLFHID
jgi:uncharacterized protein (TIGR02266 family)